MNFSAAHAIDSTATATKLHRQLCQSTTTRKRVAGGWTDIDDMGKERKMVGVADKTMIRKLHGTRDDQPGNYEMQREANRYGAVGPKAG